METTNEKKENTNQNREEAMAETQAVLSKADEWVVLATFTDENGDLCGAAKLFADTDNMSDVMINTGLRDIAFGRAILRAALHLSYLINNQELTETNQELTETNQEVTKN